MTIDVSTSTTTNSGKTTVIDWFETAHPDTTPLVRYGFPRDGGGQTQELKLRSLYEPVPEEAITSSAIYFVTDDQLARLEKFADNPYAIKGSKNIVKEIQGECEDADRVRYPVYAESDARDDGVSFTTMTEWIRGFVESELNDSPAECTFWYSGSRSIHVHVPKFLTHTQLTEVRRRAEQFCEERDAELDTGIYKAKQQFRLPGATHRKSAGAFQKVRIDPSWENDRIIRTAGENHSRPESYLDMLETTFSPQMDGEGFALDLDTPEDDIETPLIERKEYPENAYDVPEWSMYWSQEFSPYAKAVGNPRSLAVFEVKRGAFAREDKRNGAPMVPVWFIGAIGCDPNFTKETEHGALQLSEGKGKDYEKWVNGEYRPGDYVVIHGGQSRSSIIHSVTKIEALQAGYHLIREGGGRNAARRYLSDQGYEVGASGSKGTTTSSGGTSSGEPKGIFPARKNSGNPAEDLQRKAELDGIESITHPQRVRVACRHLRQGWEPTWNWFKEQYGSDFDSDLTWKLLRGVVENPDYTEYNDIDVPDKPT
ncbi:hypothetical protein [Halobaculum rarum]|uniref:hypothetical protein n=1 Tax=Halobaculum rarum TaxID=3075122 RepID=UPI0032AF7319